MADPDPLAPRHIGSALSLTGLVVLMASEGVRPEILGLACGCLAAALVAFAIDLRHTPKRQRSRKKVRRPMAPATAQRDAAPTRSALPHDPRVHPTPSTWVRTKRPLPAVPAAAPVAAALRRRALKDVRNRRIAREN